MKKKRFGSSLDGRIPVEGAYQKAEDFLKQSKEVGKENIGVPLKECKEDLITIKDKLYKLGWAQNAKEKVWYNGNSNVIFSYKNNELKIYTHETVYSYSDIGEDESYEVEIAVPITVEDYLLFAEFLKHIERLKSKPKYKVGDKIEYTILESTCCPSTSTGIIKTVLDKNEHNLQEHGYGVGETNIYVVESRILRKVK